LTIGTTAAGGVFFQNCWIEDRKSMIEPGAHLGETQLLSRFLHDADGNLRAALICWGVVIGALVVFRISREVLLACLVVAAATVALASSVIDAGPVVAKAASSRPPESAPSYRAAPPGNVFDRN
jgi:hypothetical protein